MKGAAGEGGGGRRAALGRYYKTLSHLTAALSKGQSGGQSSSKEGLFRFRVHRKGLTNTGAINFILEMSAAPSKTLSSICSWAGVVLENDPNFLLLARRLPLYISFPSLSFTRNFAIFYDYE